MVAARQALDSVFGNSETAVDEDVVDRHQPPGEHLLARPGRLKALAGRRGRISVAAINEFAKLGLVEGRIEVSGQDPGDADPRCWQALECFFPAIDAHVRGLGMHGNYAQPPAVREDDHGAGHAEEEVRLVREGSEREASVEAGAMAFGLRHQYGMWEAATNPVPVQFPGERWGQLLDAEEVGAVAIDQSNQGARIGGAQLDVGREHGERLVIDWRLDFTANRSRQNDDCETCRCDCSDGRRSPIAQRYGDAGDQQRCDRGVGGEPHQRCQRTSALQSKGADKRPKGDRNHRHPDQPVASRPRCLNGHRLGPPRRAGGYGGSPRSIE